MRVLLPHLRAQINSLKLRANDQMLKHPDVKNVNKSKNRLTQTKLESKERDKKNTRPAGGFGLVSLHRALGRERLRAVTLHGRTCCY